MKYVTIDSLIETQKLLYIFPPPYNINIKYNFHFAFHDPLQRL